MSASACKHAGLAFCLMDLELDVEECDEDFDFDDLLECLQLPECELCDDLLDETLEDSFALFISQVQVFFLRANTDASTCTISTSQLHYLSPATSKSLVLASDRSARILSIFSDSFFTISSSDDSVNTCST